MGFLSSSPTSNSSAGDRQRISDLEHQLKDMSYTAAAALDRVSELEQQLVDLQSSGKSMSRSSSTSSRGSFDSAIDDQEKLRKLVRAVDTIHKARAELREPTYFRYV